VQKEVVMCSKTSLRASRFAALAFGLALCAATGVSAGAEEGRWSIQLEGVYTDAAGHDPHVLSVHEIDASSGFDSSTGTLLETESDLGFRIRVEYSRGNWTWGFANWVFYTDQSAPVISRSADSGTSLELDVPGATFVSSGPDEVLFYRVLEDTSVQTWTVDLYATRRLVQSEGGTLGLKLGAKFGDFDNDYRTAAGIEGIEGVRFDASSNYGRMMGPLVGIVGDLAVGRSSLRGSLAQSVIFGDVDLSTMTREFVGPFGESPEFVSETTFATTTDVAIPVTELELEWLYPVWTHLAVGVGVSASAWWDVPVPPGVSVSGGPNALAENTIIYMGLSGIVRFDF
jgi:hypothetical protein